MVHWDHPILDAGWISPLQEALVWLAGQKPHLGKSWNSSQRVCDLEHQENSGWMFQRKAVIKIDHQETTLDASHLGQHTVYPASGAGAETEG